MSRCSSAWSLKIDGKATCTAFGVRGRTRYPLGETYRQMLASFEAANADAEKVAVVLTAIARFHYEQSEYTLAEPLFARVLRIMEDNQEGAGPTISALNEMASILQATDRLDEAEVLCRQALALSQQPGFYLDPQHLARSLNSLAVLFHKTDRLAVAELVYRRAIAIDEAMGRCEDSDIASHLGNLACLLRQRDRFSEAEPLLRRALAIDEQIFGPLHPKVAICLKTSPNCWNARTGRTRPSP